MIFMLKKIGNKARSRSQIQRGYSLLELLVAVSLGIIILGGLASVYLQIAKTHTREQRILDIEQSLIDTQITLEQSLLTLPSRGLNTYVDALETPALPIVGTIKNPKTSRIEPVRLGVITPSKLNGHDAFTILYADSTLPRFTIGENTVASGEIGTAKIIASSGKTNSSFPIPGGSGGGKGLDELGKLVDGENNNDSSLANATSRLPLPSDSPSSSPSPTSSPNPKGGGVVLPSNNDPKSPNIPLNSTLTGLPYLPTASMFKEGEPYLLIGRNSSGRIGAFTTGSRLVKITNASQPLSAFAGVGQFNQKFVEVDYDLCNNGPCLEQLPGVMNFVDAPKTVGVGGLLVPLKVVSFYLKRDNFGSYIVMNEGGIIIPSSINENGEPVDYKLFGGTEKIIGQADNLVVSYNLADGSVQPTPNNPIIPWLNNVTSVDINLTRTMPSSNPNETFNRKVSVNFPVMIRNLD
jgi:type II secretory pathway pseudopilin PulG